MKVMSGCVLSGQINSSENLACPKLKSMYVSVRQTIMLGFITKPQLKNRIRRVQAFPASYSGMYKYKKFAK